MLFRYLKKLGFCSSSFFFIFICWDGYAYAPQMDVQKDLNKAKASKTKTSNINLKHQLSQTLSLMAEVHESIKKNHYKKFQAQISDMIKQLDHINVFREPQLTYHQRNYLGRQLHTIKENLRFVMLASGFQSQSMQILKKVNKELIHISRIYSLHDQPLQQYSFYFCSQTESAWIQKSDSKAYNPFQKGYQNCGQKIR